MLEKMHARRVVNSQQRESVGTLKKKPEKGEKKNTPRPAFPKNRPDLVVDEGGGGFWICDAVGARDWRMEYVRCMIGRRFVLAKCRDVCFFLSLSV